MRFPCLANKLGRDNWEGLKAPAGIDGYHMNVRERGRGGRYGPKFCELTCTTYAAPSLATIAIALDYIREAQNLARNVPEFRENDIPLPQLTGPAAGQALPRGMVGLAPVGLPVVGAAGIAAPPGAAGVAAPLGAAAAPAAAPGSAAAAAAAADVPQGAAALAAAALAVAAAALGSAADEEEPGAEPDAEQEAPSSATVAQLVAHRASSRLVLDASGRPDVAAAAAAAASSSAGPMEMKADAAEEAQEDEKDEAVAADLARKDAAEEGRTRRRKREEAEEEEATAMAVEPPDDDAAARQEEAGPAPARPPGRGRSGRRPTCGSSYCRCRPGWGRPRGRPVGAGPWGWSGGRA